jgi:hypothetical protein
MVRRPGLQRIKGSDTEEVEKARLHIIALLGDPHYRMAAIQMKRSSKLTELLKDSGGKPSVATMVRTAQVTKPQATTKRRGRSNETNLTGLKILFDAIERKPVHGRSLIDWCRKIARKLCPEATDKQIEEVAKATQRKLLDIKRRKLERK